MSIVRKASRTRITGVVALAVAASLAAWGGPAGAAAKTSGRTVSLSVAETTAPNTLDPQASPLAADRSAWELAYQCLLTTSAKGAVQPQLATGYTVSSNGLKYTFHLRHGVTFDDGSPFTSADVVYTFHRLMTTGTAFAKKQFTTLTSVTASGTYTVTFTLSQPTAGFIGAMANPLVLGCAIMSSHAPANTLATHMDGTGPFEQVSYIPDSTLVMQRFANYWGPKPSVQKLTVLYVPTASSQVADLQAKKVNLIFTDAAGAAQLKGSRGVHVQEVKTDNTVYFNLNPAKAPFTNVDVRRAVALAINRKKLAAVAYQGAAQPSVYVPPSYSWGLPVSKVPYSTPNQAKAKKLLKAAGYGKGLSTSLIYIPGYDPGTDSLVQLLASELGAVGIHVKLVPLQTAAWVAQNTTHADYTLSWNAQGYYSNTLQYVKIPVDITTPLPADLSAAFNAANAAKSTSSFNSAINKIQKIEANDVFPDITLLALNSYVAYSSSLHGVTVPPSLARQFLAYVK